MFIAKGLVVPAAAVLAAAVAVAVSQVAATTYVITSLDDDFNYDHVPGKIITGDSFQFIFGGEHNAVAAANNTTCTPLADLTGQLNSGDNPADGYTYTFTKAGVYNFISTKPGECQKGMRASVEVLDGTASSGLTTFKTTKASSDAGEDGSTQPTAAPTATTSSKAAASGSTTASAAASTSSKSAAGGRVGGAMEVAVAGGAAAVVALFAL
ncbi:hypothetical protein DFJ73DRAFT_223644 [Zopfochytrium polystomum]|nr:hypothetical protein DFJ73DRAFT_223644 [Zopfochytrium polystomum]